MKIVNSKLLAILLVSSLIIAGCKKDETKGPSEFAGNYVISSAEIAQAVSVPTVESGNVNIPVGTDITTVIQQALLSAVTCESADKSYVELREDYSLYLSCEGNNPLNAGTWDEVSATSIKLNMNSAAIPTSPSGYVLTVSEIVKGTNNITGVTTVPIPKEMIGTILSGMGLTISPSASYVYLVKFSIEFIKK